MPQQEQDPAVADSRYTGRRLLDAYSQAIQDFEAGTNPAARDAVSAFGQDLDRVAMRPDGAGIKAREAQGAFNAYFAARTNGEQAQLPQFPAGFAPDFEGYDIDGGQHEDLRRADLIGPDSLRKPSYWGPDGGLYVDAAGVPTRIPVERYAPLKDNLVRAYRGELPMLGGLTGGMSTLAKAMDYATRGVAALTSDYDFEDIPPSVDVPTADPAFPFPFMPSLSGPDSTEDLASHMESYAKLQNPLELRAMQEILAKAAQDGELEMGAFDHFTRTAGFLVDFAATTAGIGAAGKAATGLVGGVRAGLAGETLATMENVTKAGAGGLMSSPVFSNGFQTIRHFAGYQVANDALYGRISNGQELAASGLAGAKEGAIMVGAGMAMRAATAGILRTLAGPLDPATGALKSRMGPLGKAAAGLYYTARGADPATGIALTVDQLAEKAARMSASGRGLRETLVRQGWEQSRAEMLEGMIDSAGLGVVFGAYNYALSSPDYDKLHPYEKLQRMVDGLTSPEAIGGAAAFAGQVLAHAHANKFKWGKQWENAPPPVIAKLDLELQNVMREIAQPSNLENLEAFRSAFDAYRKADPKAWEGVQFRPRYEMDARMAVMEGIAESTMTPAGAPEGWKPEEPPPEGPTWDPVMGPKGGPGGPVEAPGSARPEAPAEDPARSTPPPGLSGEEWAQALAGEVLKDPNSALARLGIETPKAAPGRAPKKVAGSGADLMRSIERSAELEKIPASDLVLAPEEMQYKSGTDPKTGRDPEGPLTKLKSADEWSDISAGTILVYERANGEKVVVDGHQRTNAAKRLSKSKGGEPIKLNSFVVRESDGITVQQARALGAVLNTRAGTGKAVDVAKVVRDLGWSPEQVSALGARGAFADQAIGLSQLADPVFSMVVNEQVPANLAAEVGRFIPRADEQRQLAATEMIRRTAKNVDMARSIASSAATEDLFTGGQTDLFGGSDVKTKLELRAEIVNQLRPGLKRVATAMKQLAKNAEAAKEKGVGDIDRERAAELAEDQGALISAIEQQGNRRGTAVNEILNRYADELGKSPDHLKSAADGALRELEALAQSGDLLRESGGGTQAPSQSGGASLFSDPYTRGQQRIGFPEDRRRVEPLNAQASKAWLGKIQDVLFPLSEFRNERVRGLVGQLVKTFGIKSAEAEATVQLMEAHAEVWAKSTGRTVDEWYATRFAGVTNTDTPLPSGETTRSAVTFLSDGRAVLHALRQPKVSDLLHELGHVWRRDLQGPAKETIEKWAGVKDGNWTVSADEKFASAVERYVRQGKAPTPGLKGAFKQLGDWMRSIYQRIRGTGLDVLMPSEVRKAVESIWKLPELDADVALQERVNKLTPEVQGDIWNANRNKPQYVGLPMLEVVAHELRGGLPEPAITPAIRIAQAGDSVRQAVDVMKLHGVLPREVPYEHPDVAGVMVELARGGEAYRDHFAGRKTEDALAFAVEVAKRAKTQLRDALKESLSSDERMVERASALFEYLDYHDTTEPIPKPVLDRMEKAGMLDSKGRLNRFVATAVGRRMEVEMQKRMLEGFREQRLVEPQAAARPWMALNRTTYDLTEGALARALRLDRIMDGLRKRKWISPELNRRLIKLGSFYGNFWSQNFVGRIGNATIKSAAQYAFGSNEQMTNMLRGRAEDVLAKIAARFAYRAPPSADVKLLNWAIESGSLAKMKGPQDFENIRRGSGYLFDIATEINDIMAQAGQLGARFGYFTPEQIEKHGGKYRPHLYLSLQNDDIIKELREGRMPGFAGRNLARGSQTKEGELKLSIEDPFTWLRTVTHQEGKAIEYLGTINDLLHGGYAINEKTLRELDPYTQGIYERATLGGDSEASIANGPARVNAIVMGNLLKEQLDPANGKPKSAQLSKTLMAYLGVDANGKPSKDGPLYLPRQILHELNSLNLQLYNPPQLDTIFQRAMYGYEQATRQFRRGLTIGRPKHWVLNLVSSVGTNHALGRLPMGDVARSMLTGKGYYADAHSDIKGMLELVKRGNLTEKPEDWTHEKWERVELLKEAFQILNGTTFTGVGLEASVVTDALSAAVSPDIQTAGLLRDYANQGFPPESAATWRAAIFDGARRMSGGMAEADRMMHKWMGSNDANERARAVQHFTAIYQLWEMSFKWAATLRTIDTMPEGLSLQEAIRYAAQGTADYANTSPLIRSFNTSYGSFSNPLFRKAEGAGGAAARAVMREMLKGRFWMYSANMTGPLMASVATHPIRAASVMAIASGVAGALHLLATKDPEEDAAFQQALRGSMARSGEPLLDPATQEIVSRMNMGFPNVPGGGHVPDEARPFLSKLWSGLLAGKSLMFQAPSRGDETRISSLEDMAPGWGNWIGAAHGAQNFASATTGDKITSIFDGMSLRAAELSIALSHGLLGAGRVLTSEGPDEYLKAIKSARDAMSDVLPTISPFFLASRDGQRMIEVAALNGQKIEEFARGIVQVDQPDPAGNLGELAFATLWRSQRLVQPHLGGVSEREALDSIIGRLFPGVSPSDGPYWDKLRSAQGDVHYQLAEALSGSYDAYLKAGRSTGTWDSFLMPVLFGKDGPMQQFLGAEPDAEKAKHMRNYFEKFITSDEWNRSIGTAMEMARRREVRPDYFRQAITNAIRDPTGQGLLNWLDKRVVRSTPDREAVNDYAAIFFGAVKQPSPGTARFGQWEQVLQRLYAYGYSPAVLPDNAAAALRRRGIKPELAGLPALSSSTYQ